MTKEVGVYACPGVDVGHCQGRMFNIKSGVGTLKWSAPPRAPLSRAGGRNRCTRYLLSGGIPLFKRLPLESYGRIKLNDQSSCRSYRIVPEDLR